MVVGSAAHQWKCSRRNSREIRWRQGVRGWPSRFGHRETELGARSPTNCPSGRCSARELGRTPIKGALSRGARGWRQCRLDLIGLLDHNHRAGGQSRGGPGSPSRCSGCFFVSRLAESTRGAVGSSSSDRAESKTVRALLRPRARSAQPAGPLSIQLLHPRGACWFAFTGKTPWLAAGVRPLYWGRSPLIKGGRWEAAPAGVSKRLSVEKTRIQKQRRQGEIAALGQAPAPVPPRCRGGRPPPVRRRGAGPTHHPWGPPAPFPF